MAKEYVFQCIISFEADSEKEARLELEYDLNHNGSRLFDCVQENGGLNE